MLSEDTCHYFCGFFSLTQKFNFHYLANIWPDLRSSHLCHKLRNIKNQESASSVFNVLKLFESRKAFNPNAVGFLIWKDEIIKNWRGG